MPPGLWETGRYDRSERHLLTLPGLVRRRRAGRSASTSTCRSARPAAGTATSTPTPPAELGGANPDGWLQPRLRLAPNWRWPPACSDRPPQVRHGVRRRRHAVAAGRRGVWPPCSTRSATHFVLAPRRRGDHRGQPGVDVAGAVRGTCATRATPGCRWACSRWRRTCWRCWTGCTRRAGAGRRPRGAGGGFRARQPRPDLRHAGRVRRRPAALGRRGASTPGSTTCRPTRWSSRTAPRWPAGCAAASSPPPDDDVLAHRYELLDARLRAAGFDWYEVSNWSRPGGECRHNLGYWDGGEWWGAGPGRARLRRLDPVVECQASQRLCASCWPRRPLPVADFEVLDADRRTPRT